MLMPLIFIAVVIYGCVFVIRQARRPQTTRTPDQPSPLARQAPTPDPSIAPPSPADSLWTALDEHQLTRLLNDAAPRAVADDRAVQPIEPPTETR